MHLQQPCRLCWILQEYEVQVVQTQNGHKKWKYSQTPLNRRHRNIDKVGGLTGMANDQRSALHLSKILVGLFLQESGLQSTTAD